MRKFATLALVAMLAACSTNQTEERVGYYVGHRFLGEPDPTQMTSTGWMNPKTLQIHNALVAPEDDELVLPGVLSGYHFLSTGDIRGDIQDPPVPGRCKRMCLMLRDRRLLPEGRELPAGEYLNGLYDPETSLFYPASRQVSRSEPVMPPAVDDAG